MDKLLPDDVILADREYTIEQAAGMYCAEVKTPLFTKGKKQLSNMEFDTTCQLAQVCLHVARAIGLVRQKYSILSMQSCLGSGISFNASHTKWLSEL